MNTALAAKGVSFTYGMLPLGLGWLAGLKSGGATVLENVAFELAEGERVCLLGPNGAGKTTLLKLVLGFLSPTDGCVELFGGEAHRADLAVKTGFVHPEERSFYWRLTVEENLAFFGELWGMSPASARARVGEVIEEMGIGEWRRRPFSELSTGIRQKAAIARALLHDPPLLIMDEPTRSLDPPSAARFRSWLKSPVFKGRTMLIATHNPAEAADLAERWLVLKKPRLVWNGPPVEDERLFEMMEEEK